MKVYLAGPMRGIHEFNFPAFNEAAAQLRAIGYDVFNPAEHDMQHNLREALAMDLDWLCRWAEAVVLLPGWESSLGATAERYAAYALTIPVMTLADALKGAKVYGAAV